MSRAQGSTPTPRVEPGSGRRVRSARARRPGPHRADVDGRVPAAPSPLERPGHCSGATTRIRTQPPHPPLWPVVGDLLFIGEPTRRSSPPPGLTSQRAGRSGGNRSAPHSFLPRRLRSARAGEMTGERVFLFSRVPPKRPPTVLRAGNLWTRRSHIHRPPTGRSDNNLVSSRGFRDLPIPHRPYYSYYKSFN